MLNENGIAGSAPVMVVTGKGPGRELANRFGFTRASEFRVSGATTADAEDLHTAVSQSRWSAVVGIGGGGTLDVAKRGAFLAALPFVSVPTNLSHDGIASPIAALANSATGGHTTSTMAAAPVAVFVDVDVVRAAPEHHLRSGIGDVVSNITATSDYQLAGRLGYSKANQTAARTATSAALSVLHDQSPLASDELVHTLARALILSGRAMQEAGSSAPCSGADHKIAHSINQNTANNSPHGLQVSLGCVFSAYLRREPTSEKIVKCFQRHQLPVMPSDLDLSIDEFAHAARIASSIRPDRYTILDHIQASRLHKRIDIELPRTIQAFERYVKQRT